MRPAATRVTIGPAHRLEGRLRVPGDKSISHRYALLAALADGPTRITGYAPGDDCAATLDALGALGVGVELQAASIDESRQPAAPDLLVRGRGLFGLRPASATVDARNSGTTMRLVAGMVAGHRFRTVLDGDPSLRRRPMRRIIDPLTRMGARVGSHDGCAPLEIHGGPLAAIDYAPEVPSAQVKSALLIAGLHAAGRTSVTEPAPTRDHTERALAAFGVPVHADRSIGVDGGSRLAGGLALAVPGDLSSAAFLMAAATALPGSDVVIEGVGLNPTRLGIVAALGRLGAIIDVTTEDERAGEPYGAVRVRYGGVGSLEVAPSDVPALIDELPALAAVAACGGELSVHGAAELRVKESDRIGMLVAGLRALGADADEFPDGFAIRGRRPPAGGVADAAGDHRLAMAFAVAALGARGPSAVDGADAVGVSFPGFFETLESVRR